MTYKKQNKMKRSLNDSVLTILRFVTICFVMLTVADFLNEYVNKPTVAKCNLVCEVEIFLTNVFKPLRTFIYSVLIAILIEVDLRLFQPK